MLAHSVFTLALGVVLLWSMTAMRSDAYTTNNPQPSNGNLKTIPYTATCKKKPLQMLHIERAKRKVLQGFPYVCEKSFLKTVYYASTSMADAFANCPDMHFAKITFNDGKGDLDVIWHEAYFWCKNNKWEYCRNGWCRPVRHFACYKKGR